MASYRFYFFNEIGAQNAGASCTRATDLEAMTQARGLLADQPATAAVEIWRGNSLIAATKRNGERYAPLPVSARLRLHPLFAAEYADAA